MFVETTRLLIVLVATAAGFAIGRAAGDDPGNGAVLGSVLGALTGYVLGGAFGRLLRRTAQSVEEEVRKAPPAQVLVGALGAACGGVLVTVLSFPFSLLIPQPWGWPVMGMIVWLGVYSGYQVGSGRSVELLALAGLSTRPLIRATRYGEAGVLLDTSAIADGRLLAIANTGFLRQDLLVPRFVLDEVQGLADAQDLTRRRRGRQGLEHLNVLRTSPGTAVHILDDELPEFTEVDAKLVALAKRLDVQLVTVDSGLQRVAELQGVVCMNLNALADGLRPAYVPGEVIQLELTKRGREQGQGVGYLEDGTMVVVTDGDEWVGRTVGVKITGGTRTTAGRMLFAVPEAG